jgi:mannose-6-phosphate isomerase-like protein (cupin superfamily)
MGNGDNVVGLNRIGTWTIGGGMFCVELAPAAGGPGPHFHETMSESFVVLTGTISLSNGHNWIDATAGDFLYVPAGGLHAFRSQADEPASILMLFAPGAPPNSTSRASPT